MFFFFTYSDVVSLILFTRAFALCVNEQMSYQCSVRLVGLSSASFRNSVFFRYVIVIIIYLFNSSVTASRKMCSK